MGHESNTSREALILAGIQQLLKQGLSGFSMRKVAAACGLSCAAPYKHFADKEEFIYEILQYIRGHWVQRQQAILDACQGDTRTQLIEISLGYVRFMLDNPHFRSILMMSQTGGLSLPGQMVRTELSEISRELIERYCQQVGMAPQVQRRKTFVVRSLIFGAALMMDSGELPDDQETAAIIHAAIEREFDLA